MKAIIFKIPSSANAELLITLNWRSSLPQTTPYSGTDPIFRLQLMVSGGAIRKDAASGMRQQSDLVFRLALVVFDVVDFLANYYRSILTAFGFHFAAFRIRY